MRNLLLLLFCLPACTVVYYPSGHKAIAFGSNMKGLVFQSPDMTLRVDVVDNAIIIQKTGAAVSQGILSAGGTVVTGGLK